ncbi:precorrin-2 dehydrogenase/sirohydrochlorin ferrochelatase family protein [Oleidesulfovibrio sp.]|uniref:precorrin-2 dehydrogenase/sirohydrochlorin ferrochelatase family protein n=1 Tax=Oleidesulfovibrio sp. TaxID=2909707 RepID=UPI003A86B73B
MRYYPMLFNLTGAHCLIVGGGEVGRRKLQALLPCSPQQVLVIDACPPAGEWQDLLSGGTVVYECRPFHEHDVEGKALVFAATGSGQINATVAAACKAKGIPCNVADAPESGSFTVPAHFTSGDMLVTLSTGGNSPALSRRIRMDLEEWFGNRYTAIAALMGRLRPMVLALGYETPKNTKIFRSLVNSDLSEMLRQKRNDEASLLLRELLPEELHNNIGELLNDLG